MYGWDLEPLDRIESTFAVQMHIQNQLRRNPIDLNEVIALPPDQDPAIWQYEQLRAICLDLNYLVVIMAPECTPSSCPEMRAGEWQYLCAAHPSPQTCPAIDYIVHTLDGATALLNSSKYFPSRISILDSSMKHFQSIARRLYRIFAHAWFHHRDKFDEFENESRLYGRFILFTTHHFKLIPDKLISIPA
ncbi:Mob1/phocein [Zopfochytrium polystomum]|nr:Mob1/phocein [Zopfochytrium polystomum]